MQTHIICMQCNFLIVVQLYRSTFFVKQYIYKFKHCKLVIELILSVLLLTQFIQTKLK